MAERPQYRKYRSRPAWLGGGGESDALARLRQREEGRGPRDPRGPHDPGRRVYGRRRGPWWRPTLAGPWSFRRALRWLVTAVFGWIVLSLLVFLVSAQIESGRLPEGAKSELAGGFPLTSKTTILVLGSDARVKGQAEPGAQTIGQPSRSDSILLIRTGGGASARLSIPRDTVVDIPGRGRDKINAAYAYGGAALAVRTIRNYLGIDIDHLVEVDFANFPKLIDAMGGIDYKGGCVISRINGGYRNGGYTLRLRAGRHHIDGKQALALARTRHNACNPRESDLTRVRRQQKILGAIKSRVLSPWTFVRLPWVAWNAPKAVRSDMGGPSLLGFVAAQLVGGQSRNLVLKPSGGVTLPNGGAGLVVSDAEKRREVRRFLNG